MDKKLEKVFRMDDAALDAVTGGLTAVNAANADGWIRMTTKNNVKLRPLSGEMMGPEADSLIPSNILILNSGASLEINPARRQNGLILARVDGKECWIRGDLK